MAENPEENPYEPPSGAEPGALPIASDGSHTQISSRIVAALEQTRPWVTFLSVMGFVSVGFIVLGSVALIVAGGFGEVPSWLGFVYLPLSAMYFIPCLLLFRYRSAIVQMTEGGGLAAVEEALEHQKGFWKFLGISAALLVGLYALGIVAGGAAAVVGMLAS